MVRTNRFAEIDGKRLTQVLPLGKREVKEPLLASILLDLQISEIEFLDALAGQYRRQAKRIADEIRAQRASDASPEP